MKRIVSIILALMMIASATALTVSAEILYEDDFENGKDESFWDGTGKFEFEEGTMNGFDDARIGQSKYKWVEGKDCVCTDDWPCQKEFTEWIDIKVDESGISDHFCSGFWLQDSYDSDRGYASQRTVYSILYYALEAPEGEEPRTSFVRLSSDTERKEKEYPDHIYGEYTVPGDPYFNIDGDPVKLGVRFGKGNITAFVNGKIAASYDYETIGMYYTPILVQNWGCYVEFDNYGMGTYDHNVKKMTRPADYALYEGKVTVMEGETEVGVFNKAEDDAVEITAPKVEGKNFVKWEGLSVGGVDITDKNKEKIAILYGIEIGNLEDETFKITMPDTDVVLKAVYEEAPEDKFIPGDANGDEKINAKDVTAIMKHLVGATPKTFVAQAADYDANGKINAKDVTGLMKYLVNA
jgi:hypothetical protein